MSYTQDSGHEQNDREVIDSRNLIFKLTNDIQGCPYFVLGLPMKASIADVKKQFKELSRIHHPDKVPGTEEVKREATKRFQKINSAHELLKDERWKNYYDNYADRYGYIQYTHGVWSNYCQIGRKPKRQREATNYDETTNTTGENNNSNASKMHRREKKQKVFNLRRSHQVAMTWISNGTKDEEIHKSPDKVARIFAMIIKNKAHYFTISKDAENSDYKEELRNILQHLYLVSNDTVDFAFCKMFEVEYNLFALSCHTSLIWHNTSKNKLTLDDYKSKWSILMEGTSKSENEFTDFDVIMELKDNNEFVIEIPIFEDSEHWTLVVRRWFMNELHFFYIDSDDETIHNISNKKNQKQMQKIPDDILHFLMDSPLWEEGQTAYWTRVPNVKQTEAECGARTLLHGYLVGFSPNPFECLLPLTKLGQSRGVEPNDNFYPWIGSSLANLCRDWVYNTLNRMQMTYPPWLVAVIEKQRPIHETFTTYPDWREKLCQKIVCTKEKVIELANKVHIAQQKKELARQKKELKELEKAKKKQVAETAKAMKLSTAEGKKKKKLEAEGKKQHEKDKKDKVVETQGNVKKPGRLRKMYVQEPAVMNQKSQDAIAKKGIDVDSNITITSDNEDEADVSIPSDFKHYKEIYEFEAAPEGGRMFISLAPLDSSKKYKVGFDSFRKKDDGSIGYIEEHRLIRKKYDVLVGLNGVHMEGWSLDKVSKRVKKLITESPTATITFTFMELEFAGGQTNENRDLYPSASDDEVGVSAEPAISKIGGPNREYMPANTAAEPTTTFGVVGATNLDEVMANSVDEVGPANFTVGIATNLHEAMASSADQGGPNLEDMATNAAGEPASTTPKRGPTSKSIAGEEKTTLTDDVISNRQLYGFEVLKPRNLDLGVRLRKIYPDTYYKDFYNTRFCGYYAVDSAEGCIQQSKLIRSEGDVLVGINRVDLKGWPHESVQKQLQDAVEDNTTSSIHLTFMDNDEGRNQFLQYITTITTTPTRERSRETTGPYQPLPSNDEVARQQTVQPSNDEEAGQQTVEPSTDEEAGQQSVQPTHGEEAGQQAVQPSNNEEEGQQAVQPSNEVDAVILHPATADIPEHNENAKFATETHLNDVNLHYKPFDFKQFMYSSRQHIWWGFMKNKKLQNAVLCYRWMCDNYEHQFIRQCLMHSNEKQKAPKLPQLYRVVKGKELKVVRVQFRKDKKKYFGFFGNEHNEEVSEDWVIENFGIEFRNDVKNGVPYKQHQIRAGNAKTDMDLSVTGIKPIVFLQNGKDTCVYSSLASGFHFFNDTKARDTLLQHLDISLLSPNPIQNARILLTGDTLRYDAKKMKNILDDISCFPTIVQLRSRDNSIGHAVTIVGLWVFEANKAEAEPLSFEFLNWCCSTDTEKDTFAEVYYGLRFVHNKPRKEWKLCENCRKRKKCIYKFR